MSTLTSQIATNLRTVYFGENWTWVNFKETLADVSWQEAVAKVNSLNTILALVYHSGYYVSGVAAYLEGGELSIKDKYAFDHPQIQSEEEWQAFLQQTFQNAERLALLIEALPEEKLWETFFEVKYGNYYRNLHGIIEHLHYHLGQIVIIKKLLRNR